MSLENNTIVICYTYSSLLDIVLDPPHTSSPMFLLTTLFAASFELFLLRSEFVPENMALNPQNSALFYPAPD